jgi:hypothetical protein
MTLGMAIPRFRYIGAFYRIAFFCQKRVESHLIARPRPPRAATSSNRVRLDRVTITNVLAFSRGTVKRRVKAASRSRNI